MVYAVRHCWVSSVMGKHRGGSERRVNIWCDCGAVCSVIRVGPYHVAALVKAARPDSGPLALPILASHDSHPVRSQTALHFTASCRLEIYGTAINMSVVRLCACIGSQHSPAVAAGAVDVNDCW